MKIVKTVTLLSAAIIMSISGASYAENTCVDQIVKAQTGSSDNHVQYTNSEGAYLELNDEYDAHTVTLNAGPNSTNETNVTCSKNANGSYAVSVNATDYSVTGTFVITTGKSGTAKGTITDENGQVHQGPFNP